MVPAHQGSPNIMSIPFLSIIFYHILSVSSTAELLTIQHRLRRASPAQLLPRLARPATNAAKQGPFWMPEP